MGKRLGILIFAVLLVAGASAPPAAFAATVTVQVRNFSFDPDTLTVTKGDTVRWQWVSGTHTVTSGAGPSDPQAGLDYDEALGSGNQVFEFTFDSVGNFPYFCRPHFAAGMKGMVKVQEGTPVDGLTWGRIKSIFETSRPFRLP